MAPVPGWTQGGAETKTLEHVTGTRIAGSKGCSSTGKQPRTECRASPRSPALGASTWPPQQCSRDLGKVKANQRCR